MIPGRIQQLAQCAGKHPFDTAALAQDVALRMRRRGRRDQQAYKCACCAKWHIGRKQ